MTRTFAAAAAVTPLLAAGCIAPVGSPYGPPSGYVPPGAVGPYGQPYAPTYAAPGTVVIPPGGSAPAFNGGTGNFGGSGGPTFAPPPGGASGSPSFRPPADPPAVPDYNDPNNGFGGGGGFDNGDFGGGGFDDDGFGTPGGSGSVPPANDDFGAPPTGGNFGTQPGGDDFGFAPADDFGAVTPPRDAARPDPLVARMPTDGVRTANHERVAPTPTRRRAEPARLDEETLFGRTGDYRQIRGKIDFDPRLNNWSVIYDVAPDYSDEYGGSFTLHDPDGALARFRSEDIVAITGYLDRDGGVDVLGKPLYRVKRAEQIGITQ